MATVQPDGRLPGLPLSNRMVSAKAIGHARKPASTAHSVLMTRASVIAQPDDWVRTVSDDPQNTRLILVWTEDANSYRRGRPKDRASIEEGPGRKRACGESCLRWSGWT